MHEPTAPSGESVLPAATGLVALAVVLLVLVVSIFYGFPSNVLSTRDGSPLRSFSARFVPQSWGFFTKPPDDSEVVPYLLHGDGSLEQVSTQPNSRASNAFGLTRRQRAQGPELANMINRLSAEDWTDCEVVVGDCLRTVARDSDAVAVPNSSPVRTVCGPALIVETEPVPWAFREDFRGWRLDRRAVLVDAECR